jgi:hypothetical protein
MHDAGSQTTYRLGYWGVGLLAGILSLAVKMLIPNIFLMR